MDTETLPVESESISTTWLLVGTLAVLFIVHQLNTYTQLWRRGVKGPMPLPLAGNMMAIVSGFLPALVKWRKTYGHNFGMYQGKTPTIITSDVDVVRMITTKEFASFQAFDNGALKIKYIKDSISAQTGAPWKRSRSYMSPAFSGSKLKVMIPALNDRCDVMMEILEKKQTSGEGFETKLIIMPYVLDCIARCAFGVEADCQTDPNHPFVKHSKAVQEDIVKRPGFILAALFPSLQGILNSIGLTPLPDESMDFFANIVRKAVELRKDGGTFERKDFLQLIIDATETGEDENGVATNKKIPISIEELVGQSMIFFLAGGDTIATSTGFTLFSIAKHPEIQAKLQEEIDETIPEGTLVEYDHIRKMEYLDKVWSEALRLFPVAYLLQRYCNKDFSYNGLKIAAGDSVCVNNWDIHHDPQHWPEPEKFDPERFNKDAKESRHPCAYNPFGNGPRNCVAMRFAILESKMVLIKILQKYTLEVLPETPAMTSDMNDFGTSSLYPTKGIHLRHVPRS